MLGTDGKSIKSITKMIMFTLKEAENFENFSPDLFSQDFYFRWA